MIHDPDEEQRPLIIEWDYDGGTYRVDYALVEGIEASIDLAIEEAEEKDEDLLGILYCGCSTCAIRTILAVVLARAVEGMKEGLLEKMGDGDE